MTDVPFVRSLARSGVDPVGRNEGAEMWQWRQWENLERSSSEVAILVVSRA